MLARTVEQVIYKYRDIFLTGSRFSSTEIFHGNSAELHFRPGRVRETAGNADCQRRYSLVKVRAVSVPIM